MINDDSMECSKDNSFGLIPTGPYYEEPILTIVNYATIRQAPDTSSTALFINDRLTISHVQDRTQAQLSVATRSAFTSSTRPITSIDKQVYKCLDPTYWPPHIPPIISTSFFPLLNMHIAMQLH